MNEHNMSLPLRLGTRQTDRTVIMDGKGWSIAEAWLQSDSEMIVRAVNSHDALVAACQQVLSSLPDLENHGQYVTDACCATLRAAIAAATGNELAAPAVSGNLNQPLN